MASKAGPSSSARQPCVSCLCVSRPVPHRTRNLAVWMEPAWAIGLSMPLEQGLASFHSVSSSPMPSSGLPRHSTAGLGFKFSLSVVGG